MLKKHLTLITLFLVVTMVLSSCTKALPTEIPTLTQSPKLKPTVTLNPTPTLPIEDITSAVTLESLGTNLIKITNTSVQNKLLISRRFINEVEIITELQPGASYDDKVAWDGSQYYYWGENQEGRKTGEVIIITEIAETTKKSGLFFNWDSLAEQRKISDEIREISDTSRVYDYIIHGVDVKVVYTKYCADSLTETEMQGFLLTATQRFNQHWQLYEGFPLNEYRITCWSKEVEYESDLGHQIILDRLLNPEGPKYLLGDERLSHEIGHAWIQNILTFSNPWISEGMDHFNGILALAPQFSRKYFSIELSSPELSRTLGIPLENMENELSGSPDEIALYFKGSFFFYRVSKTLQDETDKTYKQFQQYLYTKYVTQKVDFTKSSFQPKHISTLMLLQDLNSFSGVDFSDLFNKFVYGTEDITKDLIMEYKYFPQFISASSVSTPYDSEEPITSVQIYSTEEVKPTSTIQPMIINPPITKISSKDGRIMVFIPEGDFFAGNELNKTYLSSFWIDQTEVTNGSYNKCVAEKKCTLPINLSTTLHTRYYGNSKYSDYPVVYINWNQAYEYCDWAGKRLPTEIEWEKAARGIDVRNYPWGNEDPTSELINLTSELEQVGSHPKGISPYGVLDMSGNAWEIAAGYFDQINQTIPQYPSFEETLVVRGGAIQYGDNSVLSRSDVISNTGYDTVGFRCVMDDSAN